MHTWSYFQIKFKDTNDIYIVQVRDRGWPESVREARRVIEEQISNTGNFEIKECTLSSLLNASHFVQGIAQLVPVIHP